MQVREVYTVLGVVTCGDVRGERRRGIRRRTVEGDGVIEAVGTVRLERDDRD